MAKKPIFENVQFLNEGLFDRFNTIEIYGLYIGDSSIGSEQVSKIEGCKTLEGLCAGFFSTQNYKYKNGKYIIEHIDKIPNTNIVKSKVKKYSIRLLNTPAGKIECYSSNNIIEFEVVKSFNSVKELADFCNIDVKIDGPNKERKQSIQIAQNIIKHQTKIEKKWINNNQFRRIDGYSDLDTEIEDFCNGFGNTCWLLGIDATSLDIFNSEKDENTYIKLGEDADSICNEINKKLKERHISNYVAKTEWMKYDGYILITTPENEIQWGFSSI